MKIEIGKENKDKFTLDIEKQKNILISGYSGVGKTNLALLITRQFLQREKESEIYYYTLKPTPQHLSHLTEKIGKQRVHSILGKDKEIKSLEKHVKIVKQRTKAKKESETSNTPVLLVLDALSDNLTKMKLSERKEYDRYINAVVYLLDNGKDVGYHIVIVTQRCVNGDLPTVLLPLFDIKCMFNNSEKDFPILGMHKPADIRYPRRNGEMWLLEDDQLSFIKVFRYM